MDLQALTPLLTSLSLTAVMFVCARRHHQSSKDMDTFTIAPAVAYLMTGAGIFFCIVPFLPGASGNIPKIAFFFYFSPFWLGSFAASAFFLRYQIVVRDNTLAYGAFRRRVVPFSEVIDLDVLNGSKSSELWVYLRNGKTLKFSGMLSDFDELVGMVNSHMGGGCPERSRTVPRRSTTRRSENTITGTQTDLWSSVCSSLRFSYLLFGACTYSINAVGGG